MDSDDWFGYNRKTGIPIDPAGFEPSTNAIVIKMEWVTYAGTLGLKIGAKMALNAIVPGSGSVVDFWEAAKYFYEGDVLNGCISGVSGVADLVTLGLASTTKDVMKESGKGVVVQSAKETAKSAAKEARRKVGQDLGKKFAMHGTKGGKDAAIKMAKVLAKSASKEATRKVGQQVGKELAKGLTTEAVEEVFHAGTKMTLNKFFQNSVLAAVSSGGHQVWQTTLEDVGEKLISEVLKQNPSKKIFIDSLFKAAKKGAEEEFKKHSFKFFAKDVGVSALKGIIRY